VLVLQYGVTMILEEVVEKEEIEEKEQLNKNSYKWRN